MCLFKQKTAYEMRISDWSSDVCSSDLMLLDGVGVAKDERAALAWFAKAANQNHILAINMVGRCYELGWGTPVDKARAAQWYKAAADRGLDWGMYNYATLLALDRKSTRLNSSH